LRQHELEYYNRAKQIVEMFKNIGYDNFVIKPSGFKVIQSRERADETYPEAGDVISVLRCNNIDKKKHFLHDIEMKRTSYDASEREKSYFAAGYLFFSAGQFDTSFANYYEAVKLSPSKALYYGYAANALYREAEKHAEKKEIVVSYGFLSSKFARQAIELDYENPRWHFYQYLALALLIYYNVNYIIQAAIELERALELCRNDQNSLRSAILSSKNTLAIIRDSLRASGVALLPAAVLNRL